MKLISAPDNAGMFFRQTDDTNTIEFGVWRVMFGYRIRAGFVGEQSVDWDWCGGANVSSISFLYSVAEQILLSRELSRDVFKGVPMHSNIKPYYNDNEFVGKITGAVPGGMRISMTQWSLEEFHEAAGNHMANLLTQVGYE